MRALLNFCIQTAPEEGEFNSSVPNLSLDWKDESTEAPAPERMGDQALHGMELRIVTCMCVRSLDNVPLS